MKKLVTKYLSILFLVFISSSMILGQGIIRGVVTDSLTSRPLIGANAFILGTALGSAADLEGKYRITNVPEGKVRLKISYIGYKSKTIEVTAQDNKTLEINIGLSPDVLEGKTVVVTGQALGQAAAINQQLRSNTIVNVVSEEKIKELPDANAAEAIGRLPGVSVIRSGGEANKVILRGLSENYTNITIDGMQIGSTDSLGRGVDLSTISQSSLAGIQLYKAITSDMDGDAIAGAINFVTKKASEKRTIRLDLKGDYNGLMKSFKNYNFALHYGERFFNNVLGVQVVGNLENVIRSSENINLSYDQTLKNQTSYFINDFTLGFNNEIRKRNGASLLLDINTPDNGTIRIVNIYSGTKRDWLASTRNYPAGAPNVRYTARQRTMDINTYNSFVQGDNRLFGLVLNWGLAFAQSKSYLPYDYEMEFIEPSLYSNGVYIAGMRPTPQLQSDPQKLIPLALNNFNAATAYQAYYRAQQNLNRSRTAYLNISKEYTLSNLFAGDLKFGGKYKEQKKSNVSTLMFAPYYLGFWQPYEKLPDGSIVPKDFSGSYFTNFYQSYLDNSTNINPSFSAYLNSPPSSRELFGLYNLNPILDVNKLEQWYQLNKNGINKNGTATEYYNDPTASQGNYDVTERVSAAYLMNTLNVGQIINFIAGVRVESENNDYQSMYSPGAIAGFPAPIGSIRDTTASHSETIVLPNFQLNVKTTDFMSVRLAAYKALSRPSFNYRLNTKFATRNRLIVGNPNLKTAQAWNYEINVAFYGNQIGLLTVSAFYKEISDMYHTLNGLNVTGNTVLQEMGLKWKAVQTGTYALYVPYNSPQPTKVWGFELEHQINFTFLPGFFQNFVLSYNASLVHSETHLIGTKTDTIKYFLPDFPGIPFYRYEDHITDIKQQLENQPEFYGNIAVGYDFGGFSARVSLFHQSQYNLSFTPTGRGDLVVNGFTRIDLALKQKINEHVSVLLNVQNLTNIKDSNSLYDRVNQYKVLNFEDRYGLTADFGVTLEL